MEQETIDYVYVQSVMELPCSLWSCRNIKIAGISRRTTSDGDQGTSEMFVYVIGLWGEFCRKGWVGWLWQRYLAEGPVPWNKGILSPESLPQNSGLCRVSAFLLLCYYKWQFTRNANANETTYMFDNTLNINTNHQHLTKRLVHSRSKWSTVHFTMIWHLTNGCTDSDWFRIISCALILRHFKTRSQVDLDLLSD